MITKYTPALLILIIIEFAFLIIFLVETKDRVNEEVVKTNEVESNNQTLKQKKEVLGKCTKCDREATSKTHSYGNLCNYHWDVCVGGLD